MWILLAGVLTIFLVWAAMDSKAVRTGDALPKGATQIKEVGNGWYEFTYKNQRFLYHHYKVGNDMSECLAVIKDE